MFPNKSFAQLLTANVSTLLDNHNVHIYQNGRLEF